jgi:CelD/BcsL family acetyltransferase involved in cellulose biosynthesis
MRLEPVESLDAIRDEWSGLAQRSGSIFASWQWATTWWRHFGNNRPLRLSVCRDDEGELRAILPLYVWRRRPLRVLRFVGHDHSDELGPICAYDDRPFAVRALVSALQRERASVLIADDLPGSWPGLSGRVLSRDASPIVRFSNRDWDDYLASRSGKFRQELRRKERRLEREHQIRYRLADATTIERDLEALFQLHEARWGTGTGGFEKHRAFHGEFAATALSEGWLRLWLLELDGGAAAAWYGFRFAGTEFSYQGGRDPRLNHLGVGLVLFAHSIRAAQADGLREYRFLRGGEQYKFRFANEDPGVQTMAVAHAPARTLKLEAAAYTLAGARVARLAANRLAREAGGAGSRTRVSVRAGLKAAARLDPRSRFQ